MSTAAEEAIFSSTVHWAARSLRAGCEHDLPQVRYPENFWPPDDAPQYTRTATRMWRLWASKNLNLLIDDDFRRQTAEEFPPPMDQVWLDWYRDALHDKMLRENRDYFAVLFLSCAIYFDDSRGIAREMSVVLDRAGWRAFSSEDLNKAWQGTRLEATWYGLRALDKSWREWKPKDNFIAYMRAYVAQDAETRSIRYGYNGSNDPIRVAGQTRLSAGLIDNPTGYLETPFAYRDSSGRGNFQDQPGVGQVAAKMVDLIRDNQKRVIPLSPEGLEKLAQPDPDKVRFRAVSQEESERTIELLSECCRLGERELIDLILDGIPAAEAERRLGIKVGAWRNLRKRICRKFTQRPTAPPRWGTPPNGTDPT